MKEYRSTPEGKLWHAVLATYYIDAASKSLTQLGWISLFLQAGSLWAKSVCDMIELDHDFFLENLQKIRANRRLIKCGQNGKIWVVTKGKYEPIN